MTGKISGIETRTRLTALDCLYIGRVAKSRKQYALAVEWLNEARRLAKLDQTVDIPTVQAELVALIHEVNSASIYCAPTFECLLRVRH